MASYRRRNTTTYGTYGSVAYAPAYDGSAVRAPRREEEQVSLGSMGEGEVLEALRRCQPDTLTPIEAMGLLYELKQKLS